MQAQWRSNTLNKPYGDASEIADRLEWLRSQDDLTHDLILQDAAKLSSPLHSRFEWSDAKCGKRFRRIQVSQLMNQLRRPSGQRIYVKTGSKAEGNRHYDLVTRVLKNPSLRRPIARRALMELSSWSQRYGDFPELKTALAALKLAVRTTIQPAIAAMEGAEK